MKSVLLGTALLAGSFCAQAQATLVSNINLSGDSYPSWITIFKNKVVFAASNDTSGHELFWLDNDTAKLLYDMNPVGDALLYSNNAKLAVSGNYAYFPADNGITGTELYRWDGTAAPSLVLDLYPGGISSGIEEVVAHNGLLYFGGLGDAYGNELWSYNPASGYKQRVTDVSPGGLNSFPRFITAYKNKLYFTATTLGGADMYVYDPMTNSTVLMSDAVPSFAGSNADGYTVINDKLYFVAEEGATGRELYVYDGVEVKRLTDVNSGSGDGIYNPFSTRNPLFGHDGKIYFAGDNGMTGVQLYAYNPANGTAAVVFILNPSGDGNPANFTAYAGKMYFTAEDGVNGYELWAYEGTGIPVMKADVETGAGSSYPSNLTRLNSELYFSAYSSTTGVELYKFSDSAALGVQNVRFAADVKVYPNPATETATVSVSLKKAQAMGICLVDMTGKIVYSTPAQPYSAGTQLLQVPMAQLPAATYAYRIYDNAGTTLYTGRIQKQ